MAQTRTRAERGEITEDAAFWDRFIHEAQRVELKSESLHKQLC